jgi:diaminohydroxyphosphoribosylaminopyrimidine deaminase / 5-amino-6-(5-phosphoribosylamino)uracil reductase
MVLESFMAEAIALGEANLAIARPNPGVGCVIVRDGYVIGRGATEAYGGLHAEQQALQGIDAQGATVYVSLEPCSAVGHSGRAESCCESLIKAGVTAVFIAVLDPNPAITGKGVARLQAAGIRVEVGLFAARAMAANAGFFKRMQTGRPYVRAKMAASLDGRTALATGVSQWITGEPARRDGHAWRARAGAVLAGSGTIAADDAELTVRYSQLPAGAKQPLRVVVDHLAILRPEAKVLHNGEPVLVVYADLAPTNLPAHAETLSLPTDKGKVDLAALLDHLGQRKINELHLEAGARLTGAFIEADLVDELLVYLAPKLLGHTGMPMFNLPALAKLADAKALRLIDTAAVGDDIRLRYQVTN